MKHRRQWSLADFSLMALFDHINRGVPPQIVWRPPHETPQHIQDQIMAKAEAKRQRRRERNLRHANQS